MMSLPQYLLVSDPYRYASPYLDPLPLHKRAIPPEHPIVARKDEIYSLCRAVLSTHGVPWSRMLIVEYTSTALGDNPYYPLVSITSLSLDTSKWS